ncbi:hypothetical protein BRADI_1g67936v3 [Brachypodium distachyon]|nr:hypothetical protein BRADI_1g67936v3 [Brachypodium distachyon]
MREKYYKRKPWILEDETGEYQYQSQLEGTQSATATYYLLMMHGNELHAVPVGSWYNYSKIAQYKQLTLEEAEEKMNRRRSNATGYERWMMRCATHGAAAFGSDVKKLEDVDGGATSGVQSKKRNKDGDDNHCDKGEENEEEGVASKNADGLATKGMEDEEEGGKEDFDLDGEIEIGEDWEHEEFFTDDDEALDIDPEERPDFTENPAPPEIKQDDNGNEQGAGGLSKAGKELKKLLRRAAGQSESGDDEDTEEDESPSPVLAPELKTEFKSEPQENNPVKLTAAGLDISIPPASRPNKKRRTRCDDAKKCNGAALKKSNIESETKTLGVKEEPPSSSEPISKEFASASSTNISTITEEEVRRLLAIGPVAMEDFVSRFEPRFRTQEDKKYFFDIVSKISVVDKSMGRKYIHLQKEYK